MSRSGYIDDWYDHWAVIRWRGAVASAIRGRRGQAFLREMLEALDAIPTKSLIAHDFETLLGVCAIGSVGARRNIDMSQLDPKDHTKVAATFGIPEALVCEIMYENDEWPCYWHDEAPELRWNHMRSWVVGKIR